MLITLNRLTIPPGEHLFLHDVNWEEFKSLLAELGENRATKIAYNNGLLELMTPLPEHERNKELISDLIKVLLEELEIEFCPLGSTTFKSETLLKGIEPDNCFYVQNESLVRTLDRIDLNIDPPPDLVLEIDVTYRTHSDIYLALGVPELWRFEKEELQINLLQSGNYVESENSLVIPDFPLKQIIPQFLSQCQTQGRNQAVKQLRFWVRQNVGWVE